MFIFFLYSTIKSDPAIQFNYHKRAMPNHKAKGTIDCVSGCGQRFPDKKPRVQGGHSTKVNEWPWQAAIQEGDRTVCGAALVSDKWVITAAHCVTEVNSTTVRCVCVRAQACVRACVH